MSLLEFLGFFIFMVNMGAALAIMIPDRGITRAVLIFWAIEIILLIVL